MTNRSLLILAAHGGGDESAANRRVRALAAEVGAARPDVDVVAAFNLGSPTVGEAVGAHAGRRVTILPLMTSAGYFAGEHLRRQIAAAATQPAHLTIAPPVGLDEGVAGLVVRRVSEAIASHAIAADDCTVLVVGHGTRRSATSGGVTIAIADAVQERFPEADVRAAFLDQEPLLEEVAAGPLRGHVVVMPFLIGGGEHALTDIPARLGVASASRDARGACVRDDGRRVVMLTALGEDEEFSSIVRRATDAAIPGSALRIGTRSSPLALWQARQAAEAIERLGRETRLVTLDTEGDREAMRPLDGFATDGPFTDALEHALLRGEIDVAVHSLKDLPGQVSRGVECVAVLPRGPADEALVTADGRTLERLPAGARVGTCSQRRAVQLLRLRADLAPVSIRGVIAERVRKAREGEVDAAVLAVAGLERLGLGDAIAQRFTTDEIMPEAGQGAIALQVRADDSATAGVVRRVSDAATWSAVEAERRFALLVEQRTGLIPAVLAEPEPRNRLRGRAMSADGAIWIDVSREGADLMSLAEAAAAAVCERVRASARPKLDRAREMSGHVALIGAGPGDPGLLTLRGAELLRRADVVVHDRLIDASILELASADAELVDASKAPGHHTMTQEQINACIVEHALRGRSVVRLKGGDPFVFGRGWEELRACRESGIPCEVVPGVTSAIAAPASAGIPVTARGVARTLAIVTPQVESGGAAVELDYAALSRMETVVFLMARGRLADVTEGLRRAGREGGTAAAVVQDGTLPTQRQVFGSLGDIARLADDAGLRAPCVLVVGATAGLPGLLAGGGRGALQGKRIVVTRPVSASPGLIAMLRAEGAEVVNCPLIRIVYQTPADVSALQHAHAWTVFTSLHAVRGFWRVLQELGRDARALAASRVAAVGPKTADELRAIGIEPDLVPDVHRASALVESITAAAKRGQRVLFPCGTLARDELRAGLRAHGLIVDELAVYDTLAQAPTVEARAEMARGVDAMLLYCPSGAASAAAAGLLSHELVIGCIGPTTGDKVRELGFEPAVVAATHTDRGLVDALAAHFQSQEQGALA